MSTQIIMLLVLALFAIVFKDDYLPKRRLYVNDQGELLTERELINEQLNELH